MSRHVPLSRLAKGPAGDDAELQHRQRSPARHDVGDELFVAHLKPAHAEVEAGADIVVMHGAPLLHGVEVYRGKPISELAEKEPEEVIYLLHFGKEPSKEVRETLARLARIRPLVVLPFGEVVTAREFCALRLDEINNGVSK